MRSGKQFAHYIAVDVGQAELPSLELVRETLVIDPETTQNRRLQVMDMDRVLDDIEAEVIGLADYLTPLNAPARHPHAEPEVVVVAAFGTF